jgi:hypothetical protein
MIQAGSKPLTVNAIWGEWVRDWKASPHAGSVREIVRWYHAELERLAKPH